MFAALNTQNPVLYIIQYYKNHDMNSGIHVTI